MGLRTLPTLAAEWSVPLDALRAFVRKREELKRLGVRLGATRAFGVKEAEQIRRAFENRAAVAKT